MKFLASLTTKLPAWVRIPAKAVSVQLNKLFILPFGMVNKCMGNLGTSLAKVSRGNSEVTLILYWLTGPLPPHTNGTEMRHHAQLYHVLQTFQ